MKKNYFFYIAVCILISSCAKVGAPSGGPKDETAPVLVQSSPQNNAVNVRIKEWTFEFDEQIQLNEPNKNLFISPPPNEKPNFVTKGKVLKINILDSLKSNTSYHLQFIDVIKDINEGNSLSNLQISFSTGLYLDSSFITGQVKKQNNLQSTEAIVLLYRYPVSDTFLREPPYYITATDKKGFFRCAQIKPDQYLLLIYEDKNKNRIADNDEDAGFKIVALTDSLDESILISKQVADSVPLKVLSYFRGNIPNQYVVHYNQPISENIAINLSAGQRQPANKKILSPPHYISLSRDSLYFYITDLQDVDSVDVTVNLNGRIDTLMFKGSIDTLKQSPIINVQNPTKFASYVTITSTYPIIKTNTPNLQLIEDSTYIPIDSIVLESPFRIKLYAAFKGFTKYLFIPKSGITYHTNTLHTFDDTLMFTTTNYEQNFLHIIPENLNSTHDYIFQLYQDQVNMPGIIKQDGVWFYGINPGNYSFRAIQDTNKNGRHDGVNISKLIPSEPIWHSDKSIEIKSEWDYEKQVISFHD